ncbi:pseudouridine-5'-phosphate glycosidase [Thermosipho atlanticus]|uniref:Pseudouridine-5'-phosphate glycosidase n=1 Tax=Thermosipho atlanticus DSM 15807 TaxID=1123380 RepID=A0A1M5U5N4_9BACT|nr:pseudouridine-5'-phosphate glycosidase [Thermosipho atlanticus]SHH58342.1 pseudouridine-5'-phosphate glycosidase [Thermosipho atlanticus DSM 15807]
MIITNEVKKALEEQIPIVALESTVLAHGLPFPQNIEVFEKLENIVRENGCIPATIGVLKGEVKIGLTKDDVKKLIENDPLKIGTRELPYAIAMKKYAATTVSSTAYIASTIGINVFATGGIGGVHRGEWDVSQDIFELSKTNIIVVSAGCKSILDIEKTLEFLESFQILVVGYKTNKFPVFYNGLSKFKIFETNTPLEIANIFKAKNKYNLNSSILVANPVPKEYIIPIDETEKYIKLIEKEMTARHLKGKEVTPYMLKRLVELSNGKTLKSNIALLENNVKLACKIAKLI